MKKRPISYLLAMLAIAGVCGNARADLPAGVFPSPNSSLPFPSSPEGSFPLREPNLGNYYRLAAPQEHCFDTLSKSDSLDQIRYLALTMVPAVEHYGSLVEQFAGFRRKSEPGRLWLLSNSFEWIELKPGDGPTSRSYAPEILNPVTVGGRPYGYISFHSDSFSTPPVIDLMGLVGDGELLLGYGRRLDAQATTADSFREMLDAGRYAVAWTVGADTPDEICVEYDNIRVRQPGYDDILAWR